MRYRGALAYCAILLVLPTATAINRTLFHSAVPEKAITVIPDVLLLFAFARGFARQYLGGRFRYSLPDLLCALVLAYSLLFAIPGGMNGILGFRISSAKILLYFAIRWGGGGEPGSLGEERDSARLVSALSRALIGVGIFGYILIWGLPELSVRHWYELNGFVIGIYAGVRRMDSIFWSPVAFGAAMGLAALFFLDSYLRRALRSASQGGSSGKFSALSAFILCSSCNLFSMSRGSWVFEAVATLILLALHRDKLRSLSLAALATIALVGLVALSPNLQRHLGSIFDSRQLGTGQIPRLMQREAGMESLVENPFGYGLGASGYIGRRETGSLSAVTDNWYIKTAQELGLVGLGLYVVLFGALMLRFFAAGVDNRAATLSLALLGGSLFMAYGSNYFDFDFQAAVFWILSGYAVNETAYPDRLAADESRDLSRDCH